MHIQGWKRQYLWLSDIPPSLTGLDPLSSNHNGTTNPPWDLLRSQALPIPASSPVWSCPAFWPENLVSWFCLAEGQLTLCNTVDRAAYDYHILETHSQDIIHLVRHVLHEETGPESYNQLRTSLMASHSLSNCMSQKMERMMKLPLSATTSYCISHAGGDAGVLPYGGVLHCHFHLLLPPVSSQGDLCAPFRGWPGRYEGHRWEGRQAHHPAHSSGTWLFCRCHRRWRAGAFGFCGGRLMWAPSETQDTASLSWLHIFDNKMPTPPLAIHTTNTYSNVEQYKIT